MNADDQQYLYPLEPAARILCTLRGEDPDRQVKVPHPQGIVSYTERALWVFAAEELLAYMQCGTALHAAHKQQQAANQPTVQ